MIDIEERLLRLEEIEKQIQWSYDHDPDYLRFHIKFEIHGNAVSGDFRNNTIAIRMMSGNCLIRERARIINRRFPMDDSLLDYTAKEWVRSDESWLDDTYEAHEQSFKAGARWGMIHSHPARHADELEQQIESLKDKQLILLEGREKMLEVIRNVYEYTEWERDAFKNHWCQDGSRRMFMIESIKQILGEESGKV